MRKRTKLIIGCLTVALALAAAVNTATASRFEVSEQRFLVLFRELTFEGGGQQVICPVNIEGSFHSRTISKMSGQLIGFITEAEVNRPCQRNDARVLRETLPWHILYLSFIGPLPNITGIEVQLNNGGFQLIIGALSCLYEATREFGLKGIINISRERGGRLQGTTLRANERGTIRRRSGSILCPSEGVLRGEGTVGTQTGWSLIFVSLVA